MGVCSPLHYWVQLLFDLRTKFNLLTNNLFELCFSPDIRSISDHLDRKTDIIIIINKLLLLLLLFLLLWLLLLIDL